MPRGKIEQKGQTGPSVDQSAITGGQALMGGAHHVSEKAMKKVTAYVNTLRVHWLVEELETLGIQEILVTEYFKGASRISRVELLCDDILVERVREIIHLVGTRGEPADHFFEVEDVQPSSKSLSQIGRFST